MKKLILLAGVAALAACGETAVEEEVPTEEVVVDEVSEDAMTAPDGGPTAGTYALRDMEGAEVARVTLSNDMSYAMVSADGENTENGTFSFNDEGNICFDPDGDAEMVCYPGGGEVADDGSWPRHDPDGNVVGTVIRVEA